MMFGWRLLVSLFVHNHAKTNYGTNSFQPNIINILRSMAEGWYLADVCKFPGSATIWQKQMMANLEMGGHFSTDYGILKRCDAIFKNVMNCFLIIAENVDSIMIPKLYQPFL